MGNMICNRDGCESVFVARQGGGGTPQKYCSHECGEFQYRLDNKERAREYDNTPENRERNRQCRKRPEVRMAKAKYQRERRRTPEGRVVKTRGRQKRNALKRDAFVENVDIITLIRKQNGRCSLCGDMFLGVHPNRLSPSLDHTVPLSRGGAHSYANTTAMHLRCNIRKGARVA